MAHGLPMLLSDIPPHREACGAAASYFPARDPARFASELVRLCADEQGRAQARLASKQRVMKFDLDAAVDQHFSVYSAFAAT
jgi:glycosyltransferase involved in cell wall biosynthesis